MSTIDRDILIKKYINPDIEKFHNSDVKIVLENLKQNILKMPSADRPPMSSISNNDVHLCMSCSYDYPNCPCKNVLFGDGNGNDNICCCSSYDPLWTKEMMTIHVTERSKQ